VLKESMVEKTANREDQALIWDHFQNEGVGSFSQSIPRLRYLVGQISPETKLLNIGIGGAILEKLAFEKGIDIHSLDPNERAIDKLRTEFDLGEKAKVGTSQEIPFGDNTFDAVVMSEVLEHLGEVDFDSTIGEVARVLKHNGSFIVTVPFNEDLKSGIIVCPHCAEQFHRWGHQQSFGISNLRLLLEDKGFSIRRIETRCFPDWSRKGVVNRAKSLARYVLGRFGAGIAQPNIFLAAIRK